MLAVVVVASSASEGKDRETLALNQSDLIPAIAHANPRTLVVAISPGPFLTGWSASVAALLDMGLPGEQEGAALVDVIFRIRQ